MGYVERVADEAGRVRVVRVLVTVCTSVFWVIGVIIGMVVLLFRFAYGAAVVGMHDVQRALAARVEADDEPADDVEAAA